MHAEKEIAAEVLSIDNFRPIEMSRSKWRVGSHLPTSAKVGGRRTLLQSITVRPVLDDQGAETGMFEIPAGGRRYRAPS